ncbi:MAG: hypothetical protein HZA83_02170 [Thaumarchaeota archaeon]|nr:hypothetical protein [Nitrososphaerota archaeon]
MILHYDAKNGKDEINGTLAQFIELLVVVKKRKAVEPIIATLLLVAISVVGGAAVYFWAGSVYNVSGIAPLVTEFAQMIGYDARDTSNIGGFDDTGANLDNNPAIGSLSTLPGTEEFIVIKLRNNGVANMVIEKIRIIGVDHTFDPDPAGATDQPAVGMFEIYTKLVGNTSSKATSTIEPSEDVRVAIRLSSEIPDHIELGKKTPIKIYTQQGNVMNYFITPGISE